MKIIEFHLRIIKIMKIVVACEIYEIHENLKISSDNHNKHIEIIKCHVTKITKIFVIPCENNENHENPKSKSENHVKHAHL